MRMMPSRYAQPKPLQVKRQVANVKHISAPLKGLSLTSKIGQGDPLTATVLDNFVIEENAIRCRAGTQLTHAFANHPIETLLPYYGAPNKLAAATNGEVRLFDGTLVKAGFTGNDWSWTSFSNLSSIDYTVAVNGINGVWSWDGGSVVGTSMVKEVVTAPATDPWVVPDQFNIVLAHMNRLWFADKSNLAVYYLPIQQKSGAVAILPLNAYFRRGGTIAAMYTWTLDSGVNSNDQLVIFSTNGECVIYTGVDPATDFSIAGIFRFDAPMSKQSVANYGGELYVLISTGVVPMSTLMRAESETLGVSDQSVFSNFFAASQRHSDNPGWGLIVNPSSGRLIANIPQGGVNKYSQMVRFMPSAIWSSWSALPSRCWGWVNDRLYFGSDDGKVYEINPSFLNDNGQPIKIDVQMAWTNFGTPASKQFKMVLPYIQSDGTPHPYVDLKVDYDTSAPTNQPDVTEALDGSFWDVADWDTATWAGAVRVQSNWSGVAAIGRVGAPRLTALVLNAEFVLTGWDVLYESGSVFG